MNPARLSCKADPLLGVILTLAVYEAARCFYRRTRWLLAHPFFLTFLVIVALLHGSGIPYARYASGGQIITFFLGPSVVALAVPVYQHRQAIVAQWPGILAGILTGSLFLFPPIGEEVLRNHRGWG
jgi:putative effector of murein hydrolase